MMLLQILYGSAAGGIFLTMYMAVKNKGTIILLVCSIFGLLLGLGYAWLMQNIVEHFGKGWPSYSEKKREFVSAVTFIGVIACTIASPFVADYLIKKILTVVFKV